MATDPRFDPQPTYTEAPPKEKSGCSSCLTGCGVVALILVVLLVIAIGLAWYFWRSLMATGITALAEQAVNATALPAEEKQEIMAELARVTDAVRDGSLSGEQAGMMMQQIVESPLLTTLTVSVAEKQYLDKSGLNDEEKAAGRQSLKRLMRGVIDKKIPEQDLDAALVHIADKRNGEWQFRQQVSDEELSKFLAAAKEAADKAEIPDQPEDVDPSAEFKRIVDEVLKK